MESNCSKQLLRRRFARHANLKHNPSNTATAAATEHSRQIASQQQQPGAEASSVANQGASQCNSGVKEEQGEASAAAVKLEPGIAEPSKPLITAVVEHCKAEQNSSCSTDSGIVIKPEPLSDCSSTADAKAAAADTPPEVTVASEAVAENTETDKLFLCRLKRKWEESDVDNEEYRQDETPLCLLLDSQEEVARRCICIANIIRSLSFIPGNDLEMSHHSGLMTVIGKLMLYRHRHNTRANDGRSFDREVDSENMDVMSEGSQEWWWPTLDAIREDILVLLANISGQMNLAVFADDISLPVLDGLLHWVVCPSAYAQDPMPTMSSRSVLSPKKLAIETLAKLCVTEINVDLVLATPPFSRIVNLFSNLIKSIADPTDAVLREFSIAIVSYLVQGDSGAARAVALQHPAINLLLDFIECAEARTATLLKTHGHVAKSDTCELLGTSIDMLRKAAKTLSCMSQVPENQTLFLPKQERILSLVMSNYMDDQVVEHLSDVLFSLSQETS